MITVAEAYQKANVDRLIRRKVALELGSSWPIPFSLQGKPALAFFYYASYGPPPAKKDDIYPPNWLAIIEIEVGSIVSIDKKPVDFYRLNGPGDVPIGKFAYPETWSLEVMGKKKESFFDLTGRLLNAWLDKVSVGSADLEKQKQDYLLVFAELVPPFQVPCYEAVNPTFFKWLAIR
jgi:hypothetical protein